MLRFPSLQPLRSQLSILLPAAAALAFIPSTALHAQTDYAAASLQDSGKVLVVVREDLKPGKEGSVHEKTESQFAQAMASAKVNDYYIGLTSLSGAPRALFLSDYSSFADWEAKRKSLPASLGTTLDKINQADGEALSAISTGVYLRKDSLSTNIKDAPGGARYLEITRFDVKPGREAEFEEAAKLYLKGMAKAVPDAHWTCYESYYIQAQGSVYIFLTALKSMAEADTELLHSDDFAKSSSADLKKLDDLIASSVQSEQTNLFHYSPRLSYPDPALVATDPDFWKPKPMAAKPAGKPTPKPAP